MSIGIDTQACAPSTAQLYRDHVSLGRARLGEMMGGQVEVRSRGCIVEDRRGERYLDCGGYGVFLLGHCHPRVIAAVSEQLTRHPLATRVFLEPALAEAARALASVAPPGLDYAHFVGSGAEAVETALKIARSRGRRRVVATHGGYHGKTLGALSVTGNYAYREPFLPLLDGVSHVPFGDAAAVETALTVPGEPCCVVLEPVQAEGGVVIPPRGYLAEVQRVCGRHDAMLVLDEIQTGLGRLGMWWGADRDQVRPDLLLVGKTLSGGVVPVAAALATADAYEVLNRDPFLHTSTFAGAPLAAAAAAATIEVLVDEDLVARSEQLGSMLRMGVDGAVKEHCAHLVTEVRGLGLLIGVEFIDEALAGEFMLEMLERGVIVNHSLNAQRVVRLTPPAVMSEAEADWACSAFAASAAALGARYSDVTNDHGEST